MQSTITSAAARSTAIRRNIFRKIDVSSRVALARAVVEHANRPDSATS
jgi:hypothetical protein